jgi:phosphatidate phosphatase APP1
MNILKLGEQMIKLIFLLLLNVTLATTSFAKGLSVISDLDDTLKITNSGDMSEAVMNALFSTKAFTGMPELMADMEAYTNELNILTASPEMLNKQITKFLRVNDITYKGLYMRSFEDMGDKFKYKYDVVVKVLNETGDDLILIGDDGEVDQNAYAQASLDYPGRIASIYIHKVSNKELLKGVVGYYTALDIAVNEYREGRMTLSAVSSKIKEFLNSSKKEMKKYFPHFAVCPTHSGDFAPISEDEIKTGMIKVYRKISKYCQSRPVDRD